MGYIYDRVMWHSLYHRYASLEPSSANTQNKSLPHIVDDALEAIRWELHDIIHLEYSLTFKLAEIWPNEWHAKVLCNETSRWTKFSPEWYFIQQYITKQNQSDASTTYNTNYYQRQDNLSQELI